MAITLDAIVFMTGSAGVVAGIIQTILDARERAARKKETEYKSDPDLQNSGVRTATLEQMHTRIAQVMRRHRPRRRIKGKHGTAAMRRKRCTYEAATPE